MEWVSAFLVSACLGSVKKTKFVGHGHAGIPGPQGPPGPRGPAGPQGPPGEDTAVTIANVHYPSDGTQGSYLVQWTETREDLEDEQNPVVWNLLSMNATPNGNGVLIDRGTLTPVATGLQVNTSGIYRVNGHWFTRDSNVEADAVGIALACGPSVSPANIQAYTPRNGNQMVFMQRTITLSTSGVITCNAGDIIRLYGYILEQGGSAVATRSVRIDNWSITAQLVTDI